MRPPLAVVLAGGQGTRVRHVLGELPKPLAPVAGRPFLEWQLRYLRRQGIARAVLSIGYGADRLAEFGEGVSISGLAVACVGEIEPLGTGGGFLHALANAGEPAGDALVCNGDSLALAPLQPLYEAAQSADAALLGVKVADAARFGTLRTEGGALRAFEEKRPGAGLVNAGVCLFRRRTLERFPRGTPLSLEFDVFPALLASGTRIAVVACEAAFLDIGTEEALARADGFVRGNMSWFA
jgi:D-glycero-alpha-D-manno-heptose 1-phosphate guanylyltransferase